MKTDTKAFVQVREYGRLLTAWHQIDPSTLYQDGADVVQVINGKETTRWPNGVGVWMGTAVEFPTREQGGV